MTGFTTADTGLLLIDIQKGFDDPSHWGNTRSTPKFETNIAALLAAFRAKGCPIFHVCHESRFESSPLHPSREGVKFMPYAAPEGSEPVFPKTTNSPFIETNLKKEIQKRGVNRLVIGGLMTAHCVATAVRMASNLDVVSHAYGTPYLDDSTKGRLVVVSDGTATFDVSLEGKEYDAETVHAIHLATMKNEFCDLETAEEVIVKLQASI